VNRSRLAVIAALLFVSTACIGGGDDQASTRGGRQYPRGGTLHVASEHYTYDPQVSYSTADWEVMRCCLLRTLFTYSGETEEDGGAIVRPDLASGIGSVSPDGLTWTFTLKPGIHYAPPFEDTDVTATDIVRALERLGRLKAGYHFYYSVIAGFDEFEAGGVDSISGVTVPEPRTLTVHLTRPAGDLPNLFAMPATAPIPEGATDGHHREYERFLVSSGPYMFEGSQALDPSLPPPEQKPVAGYRPGQGSAVLVRNPSWDPGTDAIRGAYVDRIELSFHGFEADTDRGRQARAADVEHRNLDLLLDDFGLSINPEDADRYRADPSLVGGLLTGQQNSLGTLDMDVSRPPFDDVNVRRAVMYALDREEIIAGPGVAFAGIADLPTHLAPDSLEGGLLASYDPYPDHGGNLEAAKQAMAASTYDRDHDGECDDPICRNVPIGGAVNGVPRTDDEAVSVRRTLRAIGVRARVELFPDNASVGAAFDEGRVAMKVEVSNEWFADYPNGTQFFTFLYASSAISPSCCNSTLLGATVEQLRALGRAPVHVPSVDDRIDACQVASGIEQTKCWAQLDQFVMEEVVPAVPILIPGIQTPYSTRVLHASIDQWTAVPALDQVALEPGSA
jgi:peptide/nickel transport system substrate-binding protein